MPAFTIELPNGKRLDVEADDENAAITGAQGWYKQNVTDKTDTSISGALTEGASGMASGIGKTVREYVSKDAGDYIMGKAAAASNPKYKSGYESFAYPEDGRENHFMGLDWKNAPRALVEQAPALASDLLVNRVLKRFGPATQFVGTGVNFGARTAGNEAQKRADARSGVEGTEPTAEDKLVGAGSTVSQAALNSLATSKIANPGNAAKGVGAAVRNVRNAALAEGATNAAQDAISQGAAKAGTDAEYNEQDTKAQGVLGFLGGGAFAAPHTVKAGAQAVHTRGTDQGNASTFAANRLVEHAGGIENLDDPHTAFKAMKGAMQNASDEFGRAASTINAPSTETANAISRAKAGEALSARELDAIDAEGNANLSSLARELTSLRTMRERGSWNAEDQRWAGGLGEVARNHAGKALTALSGVGAIPHIAAQGGAGLDTLMGAVPGMAQAAAGGYLGYKAIQKIEKMAGVQSPGRAFADRFADASGQVRPAPSPSAMTQAAVSVPSVTPQNSLTTPQPWGPVEPKPTPFKPDVLEPGIRKIVEKIETRKRQDTAREAMPLLRQLAAQSKPAPEAPGIDGSALNEQVKSALLMASARRKIEGQRMAEAEAAESPMIQEQGGLDAVRNPAMGKRANELIAGATALARLRRQPEQEEAPAPAPEAPTPPQPSPQRPPMDLLRRLMESQGIAPAPTPETPTGPTVAQPKNVDTSGATPLPEPEPFVLPESPHVFKDSETAAKDILAEAMAGGKPIRHAEGFKAGTKRRLDGEEKIYNTISSALNSVQERGLFHKYLSALWGSDSPEVVTQVREHMLSELPHHADTIMKHLSDEAIKGLWTKPKKKK
jgi:hypothetical protein